MVFDRAGDPSFKIVVAGTPAYKQFGNAVVVPVVEAIARLMQPHLVPAVAPARIGRGSRNRSLFQ